MTISVAVVYTIISAVGIVGLGFHIKEKFGV